MIGLFPNALFTIHEGRTGRLLSPRLWSAVSGQPLMADVNNSPLCVLEDFRPFGASCAVSSNVGRYVGNAGVYRSWEDTGDSIAAASEYKGACVFTTDTDDNDEVGMQCGDAATQMAQIDTSGGKMCIFEARFKVGQVSNSYDAFLGLGEEGFAADEAMIDAGGALADKDYIGFYIGEAAGSSLKFVYKMAGQTAQTVLTWGTALVASTYYNVGFIYNPGAPKAKRIKIFINNVEQSTYVTQTQIEAATFPSGEGLTPFFGLKNGAAASKTMTMDGWGLFQF